MKETIITIIYTALFTSLIWSEFVPREKIEVKEVTEVSCDHKIDKDKLCEAFIYVESRGDNKAANKVTKATGALQMMPIMVAEANRIVGYEKYKLSDRTNKAKSVELFHDIMKAKNPNYDIHLACKIWNPRGKISYHFAVEDKYRELMSKK